MVFRYARDEFNSFAHLVQVDGTEDIPEAQPDGVVVLTEDGYDTTVDTYRVYRDDLYIKLDFVNANYAEERFFYDEPYDQVIYTNSTRVMNCELGKAYDLARGIRATGLPTFVFMEKLKIPEEVDEEESAAESSAEESSESAEEPSESEEESLSEEESSETESEQDQERPEGDIYIRAAAVTQLYGVEFHYSTNTKVLLLEESSRRLLNVKDSTEPVYFKAFPEKGSTIKQIFGMDKGFQVYRRLDSGEELVYYNEEGEYYRVADKDGVTGYVSKDAVGNIQYVDPPVITLDTYDLPEELQLKEPISVIWQYFSASYGGYINSDIREHFRMADGILTALAPTMLHIYEDCDGELYLHDGISENYIAWAHEAGFKVWMTLENVDNYFEDLNDKLYDALSDTVRRQELVQQLLELYQQYGYDGLNIDLEGLESRIGIYFVQFMRELSAVLRPAGCMLSVDLNVPTGWNGYYRHDVMGQICDYVCLMAYDEHYANDDTAGSVASFPWVQAGVQNSLNEGIPAERLVLCMPLYTRFWVVDSKNMVLGGMTRTVGMAEAWEEASDYDTFQWDATTGQYFAEQTWRDTTKTRVWLEDTRSMQLRIDLAKNKELGGVALWFYDWDTQEIWDLVGKYEGVIQEEEQQEEETSQSSGE